MQCFEIVNWEKYQKYARNKTSSPPWIKVYSSVRFDSKTAGLSDTDFGQLVRVWITASQNRNRLPFDPSAIKRMAGLDQEPDLQLWISIGLIKLCADCTQSVDDLHTDCIAREGRGGEGRVGNTTSPAAADAATLDPEAARLSRLLADLIRTEDPKAKVAPDRWAPDLDKLHRLDGREWPEIEATIRWCQADTFWQPNIRSGAKLRKQFDQLVVKMRRPTSGKTDVAEANRRALEEVLRSE